MSRLESRAREGAVRLSVFPQPPSDLLSRLRLLPGVYLLRVGVLRMPPQRSCKYCEEVSMRRVNCLFSIALFGATGYLMPLVVDAQQPAAVTVFEGARLITGDGSAPIADSAFIVANGRFTAVGQKGQLKAPAG